MRIWPRGQSPEISDVDQAEPSKVISLVRHFISTDFMGTAATLD